MCSERRGMLLEIFHYAVVLHHWFVAYYSIIVLDVAGAELQYLKDVRRFPIFYLTTWNFAGQVLFFSICALQDAFGHSWTARNRNLIKKLQDFFFTSLVFPGTMLVWTAFWGLYLVDRELVLPQSADEVTPQWLNHSLHSVIFVAVLLEMMFTRKRLFGHLVSMATLGFFCIAYDTAFMCINYIYGAALYPLFYLVNSWMQKLLILFGFNVCVMGYYILGAKFIFIREKQV
ncbi:androgen-dependent TFPI-regulating protein-like isoform X2 [Periplaneta americana]|uniref:androgen-dependent TFPI-regulating protein-like isoform X2 n=1 Tax=Periplaneta americana TaxID=6978 RepID=UPI0037E88B9C